MSEAQNNIMKKHQNMWCKEQRVNSDAYKEGHERTFGKQLTWWERRDLAKSRGCSGDPQACDCNACDIPELRGQKECKCGE